MALSLGDKIGRVIRFLLGVRNPRVAMALSAYGFTEADMAEGWALVNGLGKGKLALLPLQARDMQTLQQLDAWENHWFPIADASVKRRYPAAHAQLFLNLTQVEGPEVAISVRTFLDRFAELNDTRGRYGAEGPKVVELLAARGFTVAIIAEAEGLLSALTKVAPPTESTSLEEQSAELERAENALWAWYLEWSRVSRVAIKQRILLRQLGFLASKPAEETEEPSAVETTAAGS